MKAQHHLQDEVREETQKKLMEVKTSWCLPGPRRKVLPREMAAYQVIVNKLHQAAVLIAEADAVVRQERFSIAPGLRAATAIVGASCAEAMECIGGDL